MLRITEIVLVACVMMVMTSYLQQTSAAPSWRPQGRFGKRAGAYLAAQSKPYYWRPQGRYGKRSDHASAAAVEQNIDAESDLVKSAAVSGIVEVPVELLSTGESGMILRVGFKPCSLTGVDGVPACNGASEGASESF